MTEQEQYPFPQIAGSREEALAHLQAQVRHAEHFQSGSFTMSQVMPSTDGGLAMCGEMQSEDGSTRLQWFTCQIRESAPSTEALH
jgi:hypothetical protein